MKPLFWSALFLALAALPVAAQGQGPRPERLPQALRLSEAQRTSLRAIREQHRSDLVLRREAVLQAQTALQAAARAAATPEAQLRALFDRVSAARFEMLLARRSVHQEIQALLTPEQRAQAAERRGWAQGRLHERVRHLRMGHRRAGMGMGRAG